MRIGIVGWGVEGQSAYKFFGPDHSYLIVNEEPRDDFPTESEKLKVQFIAGERTPGVTSNVDDLSYLQGIDGCDKVVYTPTSYKNLRKVYGDDRAFWSKATTNLDIFFETVKTKNTIGISGTKGKGTTSTLIYKLLEAESKKTYLGGNIGQSPLDFVKEVNEGDWVVLELSSFQLYQLKHSPHIGVCLMITEEHMDWHTNMQEYLDAKSNLFKYQNPEDVAVYFARDENSKKIASVSGGKKVPYYERPGGWVRDDGMILVGETEIIHKSEIKLLGEHNLQNICAAVTAVAVALRSPDPSGFVRESGIPQDQPSGASRVNAVGGSTWVDKAKVVLSSFSGLEHRLELVRELQGVKYYDDSFATTPDAAIVALKAFEEPKVVILGGSDKGLSFDELAKVVAKTNVRHAVVIGDTAETIADLLKENGFSSVTVGLEKMPEIVEAARRPAQPGDVVLLSTGCASFGLFKDYKDRGNQFKQSVLALR